MKKYQTGIMSNKIELLADNIDEAICVSMLYFQSNAPIAVYNTDEESNLTFPYNSNEIDGILSGMNDKLKTSFDSIKDLTNINTK